MPNLHASPIIAELAHATRHRTSTDNNNVVSHEQNNIIPTQNVSHNIEPEFHVSDTSRNIQNVLTKLQRAQIVRWMVQEEEESGDKHICAKVVKQFPLLFRGNMKANLQRASRYYKACHKILSEHTHHAKNQGITFSRLTASGVRRHAMKAASGRGRKRAAWVTALHFDLVSEFDRMRKAGVKFNRSLMQRLAVYLIKKASSTVYNQGMSDPRTGKLIVIMIDARWIQTFTQVHGIIRRSQTGKLMVSPEKQEKIEREVAEHLGKLKREFESGKVSEDDFYNADETHFVVNMDDHKTLAQRRDEHVKYADVVSGDQGMTMMVLLAGGNQACICPPFIIFQNQSRNYPIRGVKDDIPGLSYRTGPKGWRDRTVMIQWLKEPRAIKALPNGRRRILYLDNCVGHALTDDVRKALEVINTEVRYFPKNATDLLQPADSFVIQKIKCAWRKRWDDYKLSAIMKGDSETTRGESASGRLRNPGKRFFLQLAANAVKDVQSQRDRDGVLYSRRAMILCGMALNLNGKWEERQLSPTLQEIAKKYRENFDGKPVHEVVEQGTVVAGCSGNNAVDSGSNSSTAQSPQGAH